MAEENLVWERLEDEHVVQDEWIDIRKTTFKMPDGTVAGPFYNYSRRNYVVVVASDLQGNYLCVRQFRCGTGEVTTEFPAGGIERTDGKAYGDYDPHSFTAAEDAFAAAKRELKEETGYVSDEWKQILCIPSNATVSDNYAWIYVAKNCRKVSEQELDETEFLNVKKFKASEIDRMIQEGKFQQAVHVMAWYMLKAERR